MATHSIVHIELSAKDPSAAGQFYADLFGWKVETLAEMDYVSFTIDPNLGGGFVETKEEDVSVGDIFPYVSTPDIEKSLARVEELGGKTYKPKTEIPGIGWYAIFLDPTGNRIGLFTSTNA
jgi:predicted enzyme related to lactoylglutathione lyase